MRSVPAILVVVVSSLIQAGSTVAAHDDIEPHWIWVSAERSAGQAVTLRRTFRVPGQAVKARLDLAADFTRCHVKLNGETLTELDEYGPWLELDVTEQLKPGENTFELKCVSGAGPAAIAMTLGVMLASIQPTTSPGNPQPAWVPWHGSCGGSVRLHVSRHSMITNSGNRPQAPRREPTRQLL